MARPKKYNEPVTNITFYVPQSRKEEIRELVRLQLAFMPYVKYHSFVMLELEKIGVFTRGNAIFKLDWLMQNDPKDVAEDYRYSLITSVGKEHE